MWMNSKHIQIGVVITGMIFSLGFASNRAESSKVQAPQWVWITKSDGGKQCEKGSGVTLGQAQADLESAEVKVSDSRNISSGMMVAAACGMPTGRLNAFKIDLNDFPKAQAKGFVLAKEGQIK